MCQLLFRKMNSEDGQVYFVCILQFSCFTKYNRMQSKQNVNIADETFTDHSFLSRYHYTKSKNYLKKRYQIRHWISMFNGTPCMNATSMYGTLQSVKNSWFFRDCRKLDYLWLTICNTCVQTYLKQLNLNRRYLNI